MTVKIENKKELIEKITAEVRRIWTTDEYPYKPDNIEVDIVQYQDDWAVEISISSMYRIPVKFSQLMELSKYFAGTTRIDTINNLGSCEVCDYDSGCGFLLRVLPPTKEQKSITQSSHGWMLNNR
jgi:hypothetical protein